MDNAPQALWRAAPNAAHIAPARRGEGDSEVRTGWSLISRGTERLVSEGRVPKSEWTRMRAPHQEGDFPFPVKYGYAAVGDAVSGPHAGRSVFALFPHQTHFRLDASQLIPLPAGMDPRRAALAANMETALNALWDAGSGPGDKIAVIGGGLVGCLVAFLAGKLPGADVTLVDVVNRRADVAAQLNVNFALGEMTARDCDASFHTSVSAAGLKTAIECLGSEGILVEMSWYGEGETPIALGGAFHAERLRIISSQVGKIAPSRRPRWNYGRRLAKALELCADPALDCLIDH
ncbi:MAG: zinc-binding alcohol dehydrogenase, partial [Pseudomonadota bacterium]